MLPIELLKTIFGVLSGNDFDAVMLVNVLFRDMALRDFVKKPLRYFESLMIYGHKRYRLVPLTWNMYRCEDDDDFCWRMRMGRVGTLR